MELTIHKTKYNIEVHDKTSELLNYFADGHTLYESAQLSGLTLSQFYQLCKEDPFLYDIYVEAKALNKQILKDTLLDTVVKTKEDNNGENAKWLLERIFSDEFGKNNTLKVKTEIVEPESIIDITRFCSTEPTNNDVIN